MRNQNYPGRILQQKGYVKHSDNGMKAKEKQVFVDPITGDKTTKVIKIKQQRQSISSSSSSSPNKQGIHKKSKHTYDKEVKNTPYGVEITDKEKYREGGVMENTKNKINNLIHK